MYDDDSLYTPKSFVELEQDLLNSYNQNFNVNLTIEQFRHTNIYAVHLLNLQLELQNENNCGLLFSKIVEYIQGKQEFEIIPKGATFVGLENALKALNDINNKPLIKTLNLADCNTYPTAHQRGQATIVLEYENNQSNNNIIAECLANNAPLGIEYLGDISNTFTTQEGYTLPFKWTTWQTTNIKVKVHYKINRNFYGDKLAPAEITTSYFNSFVANYKPGQDLLPAKINDISNFAGLAYVNTEISVDNGATYLPLNAIIEGQYNIKYNIADKTTDITLVLDN